jgi:glycosyltransferase involved in cell wall biosynthesis
VSVIVPAYNAASFLAEALESINRQTRRPDQVIVVNDGSTDQTAEVARRYVSSTVQYFEQENKGVAAARNLGLRNATGDFIAFLDSDDRWLPTMVERQLAMVEPDPAIVCSIANFMRFDHPVGFQRREQFHFYPELQTLPARPGPLPQSLVLEGDAFCSLVSFQEIPCYVQVSLFRASLIRGLAFNEAMRLGSDYEFVLRTYMKGRVAFNPEILAEVRRHDTNITRDYSWAPVSRLRALESIKPTVSGAARLRAYSDRLVKAHVDAACEHVWRGQYRAGASVFRRGLSVPGSPMRKLKGFARVVVATTEGLFVG